MTLETIILLLQAQVYLLSRADPDAEGKRLIGALKDKIKQLTPYNLEDDCIVCGEPGEQEPRFGYAVCHKHANIPPTEIEHYRNVHNEVG